LVGKANKDKRHFHKRLAIKVILMVEELQLKKKENLYIKKKSRTGTHPSKVQGK
jgi:hypothetical protein